MTISIYTCTMIFEQMEAFLAVFMEKPNGDGWAHLVSDLNGDPGCVELRTFLKIIGVRRPLHRASTYAEHCDVRGDEILRARDAGAAIISRRELGQLLRKKRVKAESADLRSALSSSTVTNANRPASDFALRASTDKMADEES